MKIALLGYGKMGKIIERIALERGHEIVATIGTSNQDKLFELSPENVDVAIEFTKPETCFEILHIAISQKLKVVSGTTGWLSKKSQIEQLCIENQAAFLWSSNFSIGVNFFFEINKQLAQLMYPHTQYQPSITEIHHIQKLDAPSGTAITLAEGILEEYKQLKNWSLEPNSEQLPITAIRENEVPGTHSILYKSTIDSIEIKHEAYSREGFALGAVVAAEWLQSKQGVFGMKDVLQLH